jgi:hypothetical protein
MAKTTTDGDEDYFEARANQTDMDDGGSIEQPVHNTNDAMTKSMMWAPVQTHLIRASPSLTMASTNGCSWIRGVAA